MIPSELYGNETDNLISAESTNIQTHPAQVKDLGQIKLSIRRMNSQLLKRPVPYSKRQLGRVAEVSEKTLKGSAISSTVK